MAMFTDVARAVTRQPVHPRTPDKTTNHFRPHRSLACEVIGLRTAVEMDIATLIQTCLLEPPTTAATFRANLIEYQTVSVSFVNEKPTSTLTAADPITFVSCTKAREQTDWMQQRRFNRHPYGNSKGLWNLR